MRIEIDRRIKITLLKWLKQRFIETDDLPELGAKVNKPPLSVEEAKELIRRLEEEY